MMTRTFSQRGVWAVLAALCFIANGGCSATDSGGSGDSGTRADGGSTIGNGNPCLETPPGSECQSEDFDDFGSATLLIDTSTGTLNLVSGQDTGSGVVISWFDGASDYSVSTTTPDGVIEDVEGAFYSMGFFAQGNVGTWIEFSYSDSDGGPVDASVVATPEGQCQAANGSYGDSSVTPSNRADAGIDGDDTPPRAPGSFPPEGCAQWVASNGGPGDGDKDGVCGSNADCLGGRCCAAPGECGDPSNACTCRDP